MSVEAKAPYHFVPLSKWVYMPDWAHLVSHDVPFEDGYSGALNYTLNNQTPLCVGSNKDPLTNTVKIARNPQGQPIIPGSSLKGMLRNVLDIASFGKFNQVDNQHFSFRDVSSKSKYLEQIIGKNQVQAGWIKFNNAKNQWEFSASKHCKIHHDVLKESMSVKIFNATTAIEKYEKLPLKKTIQATISEPRGKQKNSWAESLGTGSTAGHCVFTNTRILGQGDKNSYEFSYFFYAKNSDVISDNIQDKIDNLFANHRSVTSKVSGGVIDQVAYLQKNGHPEHGIPVFALMKKGRVHSFGFAKMPRVSYKHDIQALVNKQSTQHSLDAYFSLSELMLGTLRDEGYGLKSRVNFSDAVMQGDEDSFISQEAVLSNPKASYLAAYLEQEDSEKESSYDHDDARVAGWKRYPIKREFKTNKLGNDNTNVQTKLELLDKGHAFDGRIIFHNLKKEELAALIWCITLNNDNAHCHSLGHGKPLGAGAVTLEINTDVSSLISHQASDNATLNSQHWCDIFTAHMNQQITPKGKWLQTPQLEHLLALSSEDISDSNDFSYNELGDFKAIKNNKDSLPSIRHNGRNLSRTQYAAEDQGSPAFTKGRLSGLFDGTSNLHETLKQRGQEKIEHDQQYQQKTQQKEQLANIQDSDLPAAEKALALITSLVQNQDTLNKTDKKDKAKGLRETLKTLKEEAPSAALAQQLIDATSPLNFAEKERDKIIKFLQQCL